MTLAKGIFTVFRDPVSGLTHLVGSLLGVAGLVFLLEKNRGASAKAVFAFSVFGISLILLYLASALYHLPRFSDRNRALFRRIDHTMIFVFIAGTYTPFCVIVLEPFWGTLLLTLIWVFAVAGFFQSIFWLDAPRWLSTGVYIMMGWLAIIAIYPLALALTLNGLLWLIAGGLFYTVGALVYAMRWPDPFPEFFGFHEIWHLFVLAGSACHFFSVASLRPA